MQQPTLWLIDGSSYIYRAFYALPPLTNKKGMPTGAIYGVIKMLKKLVENEHPDYICIALDPAGKTDRHSYFEQYKANRSTMPDELKTQMPYFEPILQALGFKTIKVEGEEADDVIGTLTAKAKECGMRVRISSPDKDFAQLVNQSVILENTMSDKKIDIDGVIAKFGVKPEQIIDYLALVGDSADNIPGIPKVGPKTAVKWLENYQSIAGIANNLDNIKGAVGQSLRDNFDKLTMYQKLVTIKQNLDIKHEINELILASPDHQALTKLYTELEFTSWLKELATPISQDISSLQIMDKENWHIFLAQKPTAIAIHAESDHISIATKSQNIVCQLDFDFILIELSKIKEITIIGFAVKDWFRIDSLTSDNIFDVQLAQYIIDSQLPNKQLSDLLSAHEIKHQARALFDLYEIYADKLKTEPRLHKLLHQLEMPLTKVLYQMQANGILLDCKIMQALTQEFSKEAESIAKETTEYSKANFNLASPKQIRQVLYEELSLPILKKTAKGEPSTSEEALTELAASHPLPALILKHRQLSKMLSTYTMPLPNLIAADGRIHSQFNQATTVTGRLSSNNPNLQNIPIRTEQGQKIRCAFIAKEHHSLICADYSQIELRIMAHLSQDDGLMSAFEQGLDIHNDTAAKLFDCNINSVTNDQRRKAKAINFGLIYGMSAFGLAKQIKCERQHAQALIDNYFASYPGVLHYMEATRAFVKKHGFVETLFGRRLYLPEINSGKRSLAMAAERAAINGPMQGTSADMIKKAMLNINPSLDRFKARLILQVHDELIFEVPNSEVIALSEFVEQQMLIAILLSVPLAVNISHGQSWGMQTKLKKSIFD